MTILIYACLATWCSTYNITTPHDQITINGCARSQAYVAQWAWEHPDLQIVRWDCKRIELAEILKK